jgi:hypothetical protein
VTPRPKRPGSSGALNAEQALKAAHAEIRGQRTRIGDLLGQLRDTHREHDSDTIQRLTTDNAALRQRIRHLTAQQRTQDERLQAARSQQPVPQQVHRQPRRTAADRTAAKLTRARQLPGHLATPRQSYTDRHADPQVVRIRVVQVGGLMHLVAARHDRAGQPPVHDHPVDRTPLPPILRRHLTGNRG